MGSGESCTQSKIEASDTYKDLQSLYDKRVRSHERLKISCASKVNKSVHNALQKKYDDLVSPEYVNDIPEEQLTVTTYGLDTATGIMDKAKIYKITEEELIERDILSCKEVKWLLPQGFKEAILNLEEGSKKIFNIPSELGYGKSGASSFRSFFRYRVPPHSNIKCEIELIKIHSEEEVLEIEESLKQRERLKAEDMQVQDINHNTPN